MPEWAYKTIKTTMRHSIILLSLFLFASTFFLSAQENKLRIAIFDPVISGGNFDEGTGVIIREMVSTVIVNSGKYHIIERSLIDRVLKEQNFSNSGAVDDSQISQIGKLAGANKVILSVLSSSGNRGLLSLKMIDVESANIESQKTKLIELSKILDIITPLALEVIGEKTTPVSNQETTNGSSTTSQRQANTDNRTLTEQTNRETRRGLTTYSFPEAPGDDRIVLFFPGESSAKSNPTAQIFIDGLEVGTGDLHQGFTVSYLDNHPGNHQVIILWSGTVSFGTYNINTVKNRHFTFEYQKLAFGTYLELKREK